MRVGPMFGNPRLLGKSLGLVWPKLDGIEVEFMWPLVAAHSEVLSLQVICILQIRENCCIVYNPGILPICVVLFLAAV
jgi:hypothetical protein